MVIDYDDLVNDTVGVATKFCQATGLDVDHVIYEWEAEDGPCGPTDAVFFSTLRKSQGVIKNLHPKTYSISESSKRWTESWGEDVANSLTQLAETAMVDYNYLYQFRLVNS